MVDLDEPNEAEQTYQERCHWMLSNVPVNIHSCDISIADTILSYVPPHPARGSKHHRYVFVALKQGANGQVRLEKHQT